LKSRTEPQRKRQWEEQARTHLGATRLVLASIRKAMGSTL
jgi:hypothetical protein